ncbi:MAG: ABC transporter ATP-binding protein [Alphaproteobacteria bacterium]|nr:ABC transporter ATP-binding protein [Alphaproteobacteria bacterium]
MSKKINHKQYWQCIQSILLTTFEDRKIRFGFSFSLIFLSIEILSNIFVPLILKKTVDTFSSPSGLSVTLILVSYGLIWMMSQASLHIRALFTYRIEQRITFVLGLKILSHLYTLSHSYFLNQKPGALTNVIRRAQQNVPCLTLGIFFHVLPTVMEFMFVIIIIAFLYPLIYSLLLGFTLIGYFIYTFLSMKMALENREKANEVDRNTDGIVTDWLSNHEAIQIFGKHELAIQTCATELKKREITEVAFMTNLSLIRLGQALILGVGLTSLTYLVGNGVLNGELTVGDYVLFNGYILQFIVPLSILGQVTQDIKKAFVDMKGIIDILLTTSEVKEISSPKHLSNHSHPIEFRNVAFTYQDRKILNDLSFIIEPGETVLIMGATGIGKSTIAKLLLRLYDPTNGQILINKTDLKHISFASLAQTIGWVPQESYLLNDTIKNNLQFVHSNASRQEIEAALEQACLLNFVKSLPEGIHTSVGNRGLKLSGGEKQRLALARLFLKKPKIGIFDEATSFLDRTTELLVQENINRAFPEMTKIIITHRPFMVDKADKIITLDKNGSFQKVVTNHSCLKNKINFN